MSWMTRIKSRWNSSYRDMSETLSDDYIGERAPKGLRYGLLGALIVFVLLVALGWYWTDEPTQFDVQPVDPSANGTEPVIGTATTATLINVIDLLLNKRGGYLSNDVTPPGIWLDNIPSWEFGVIVQVRDLSKAMRESFSRSQSQSTEDPDLALAESRFNVDHTSWAVPWPESEYADGRQYLNNYLLRLSDDKAFDAQFYARADNLRYWLGTVETRLGSLSHKNKLAEN